MHITLHIHSSLWAMLDLGDSSWCSLSVKHFEKCQPSSDNRKKSLTVAITCVFMYCNFTWAFLLNEKA